MASSFWGVPSVRSSLRMSIRRAIAAPSCPSEQLAIDRRRVRMLAVDRLTLFGLFSVTAMLVCYAMEKRSPWFVLGFAVACGLGSIYGFLQGAWPFGLIEAIWAIVAVRRWSTVRALTSRPSEEGPIRPSRPGSGR